MEHIITSAGLLGILLVIFAESGLLIGFFLPGDTLLFSAGFLASQGYLNIYLLCILGIFAAVIGDSVGYYIGLKLGPKLFKKEDSFFFHKKHLIAAEEFYKLHGGKTIILARFIPFIRTFAPTIAGAGKMHYEKFLFFNVIGGTLWVLSITLTGYFFGRLIPNIDAIILPVIAGVMLLSVFSSLLHLFREPENRKKLWEWLKVKTGRKNRE